MTSDLIALALKCGAINLGGQVFTFDLDGLADFAAAVQTKMESVGYQYAFTNYNGATVWLDNPMEWNGQKPIAAREIFTPPAPEADK